MIFFCQFSYETDRSAGSIFVKNKSRNITRFNSACTCINFGKFNEIREFISMKIGPDTTQILSLVIGHDMVKAQTQFNVSLQQRAISP